MIGTVRNGSIVLKNSGSGSAERISLKSLQLGFDYIDLIPQ